MISQKISPFKYHVGIIKYLSLILIYIYSFSFGQDGSASWKLSYIFDGVNTPTGKFINITAIDLDQEGNLFILDAGRNRVLKYSDKNQLMQEIGGFGNSQDRFNDPRDLDAHLTLNVFVSDFNNNRIVRFDSHLNYLSDFSIEDFNISYDNPLYFEMPLSVTVNNQYDIFVLEDLNKRIIKFDRFNQPLAAFGKASENLGQLLGPQQINIGPKNEIYVSDPLSKSIIVFDFLGNFVRNIIHPEFIEPRGIDISNTGEIIVADQKAKKVFFFKPSGKFSMVWDLLSENIEPTDVAMHSPKGTNKILLYVSSQTKCYRFTNTSPSQN
jgi:DNA-binding beta-propeller fold protein YncE